MPRSSEPSDVRPDESGRPRRRSNGREARDRRRRLATWILSVLLGVLVVNAVVGEAGYLASLRAERQAAALRAEVAALRHENRRLQDRTAAITEDPTVREELARDHHYLRPGETLFIIRAPEPPGGAPAAPDASR